MTKTCFIILLLFFIFCSSRTFNWLIITREWYGVVCEIHKVLMLSRNLVGIVHHMLVNGFNIDVRRNVWKTTLRDHVTVTLVAECYTYIICILTPPELRPESRGVPLDIYKVWARISNSLKFWVTQTPTHIHACICTHIYEHIRTKDTQTRT